MVIVSGYFPHLGMLNQLITLSHQLNSDAFNLTNHKYMAHQTALLYVRYCLIKTLPKLSLFFIFSCKEDSIHRILGNDFCYCFAVETNFLPSCILSMVIIIADPSKMQDACHMNFVIDLAHCSVSVAQ